MKISEITAFFYEVAEQYGKKDPHFVAKLGRTINKMRPRLDPFDMDDGDGIEPHERRALCQWSGQVHPYTCNDDNCRDKTRAEPKGDAWPLHPKREGGWVCLHCGLHQ